jgi:hypothetical protein
VVFVRSTSVRVDIIGQIDITGSDRRSGSILSDISTICYGFDNEKPGFPVRRLVQNNRLGIGRYILNRNRLKIIL